MLFSKHVTDVTLEAKRSSQFSWCSLAHKRAQFVASFGRTTLYCAQDLYMNPNLFLNCLPCDNDGHDYIFSWRAEILSRQFFCSATFRPAAGPTSQPFQTADLWEQCVLRLNYRLAFKAEQPPTLPHHCRRSMFKRLLTSVGAHSHRAGRPGYMQAALGSMMPCIFCMPGHYPPMYAIGSAVPYVWQKLSVSVGVRVSVCPFGQGLNGGSVGSTAQLAMDQLPSWAVDICFLCLYHPMYCAVLLLLQFII